MLKQIHIYFIILSLLQNKLHHLNKYVIPFLDIFRLLLT